MRRKVGTHATIYFYEHGCRCEICLDGHTRRHLRQRENRNPCDAPKHGTSYAYREYNCRCDLCTAAATDETARLRARAAKSARVRNAL